MRTTTILAHGFLLCYVIAITKLGGVYKLFVKHSERSSTHLSCVSSYPEAFHQLLNELLCVCDPWNWCWFTKLRSCSFGNMPRLFKRSHRYNVAKNCFLARIILLDNTNIEFNLLPEVTGADCLEKVAQVLVIQEVSLPRPSCSWGIHRRGIHFLHLPSSVLLGHGGCVMPCAVKDGVRGVHERMSALWDKTMTM